jgi:phosphoribosylformylglycinamidine synthase PurS subunit
VRYEVRVQLKSDVLNVEAKEVLSAIKSQGFAFVKDLQTSKVFILEVQDGTTIEHVEKIAKEILINEVIEKFSIKLSNDA